MDIRHFFAILSIGVLCAGCDGGNGKSDDDDDKGEKSFVLADKYLTSSIVVTNEKGEQVGAYSLAYDKYNRISAMSRNVSSKQENVYSLAFEYKGTKDLSVSGTYSFTASCDKDNGTLSFATKNGSTRYNFKSRTLTSSVMNLSGENTFTKLDNSFTDSFSYSNGDLTEMSFTSQSMDSRKPAGQFNIKGSIARKIAYTDKEDLQNFGAFALSDNYPLWMAMGFPGNRHLPLSITYSKAKAGITKSEFSYVLDANGCVSVAKRTDYYDNTAIQTLTYTFTNK